jgi:hypothetical protein
MLDNPHKDKPTNSEKDSSNDLRGDDELWLHGSVVYPCEPFGQLGTDPTATDAASQSSDESFIHVSCFDLL